MKVTALTNGPLIVEEEHRYLALNYVNFFNLLIPRVKVGLHI